MSTLTADEVQRLEKLICTAHSEYLAVAGMPVAKVAALARSHHDCEVTVLLAEERTMNPIDIARRLMDAEGEA